MYNYTCLNCGKSFSSPYKNRKFCGKKCTGEYKVKSALVTLTCDYCGKLLQRKRCNVKETKNFCSVECRTNDTKKREIRYCAYCGKPVERKLSSFMTDGKPRTDIYCSRKCMGEHYRQIGKTVGENNGCWTGGKDMYKGQGWYRIKNIIRKRDNYTCQRCGITEKEYGQHLSVHHIYPYQLFKGNDQLANQSINLVSLCEPCHRIIHSGNNHPSHFQDKYKEFIEEYEIYCKENNIDNDIV